MKHMYTMAILTAALLVTGCVTNPETGDRELSEGGEVALRTAISAGTARLIRSSTGVDAERVIEVVTEIRDNVNLDGDITADEIMATAESVIDFSVLLPEERELVRGILIYAQARIDSERVEDVTATAGEVLQWIDETARRYR